MLTLGAAFRAGKGQAGSCMRGWGGGGGGGRYTGPPLAPSFLLRAMAASIFLSVGELLLPHTQLSNFPCPCEPWHMLSMPFH